MRGFLMYVKQLFGSPPQTVPDALVIEFTKRIDAAKARGKPTAALEALRDIALIQTQQDGSVH